MSVKVSYLKLEQFELDHVEKWNIVMIQRKYLILKVTDSYNGTYPGLSLMNLYSDRIDQFSRHFLWIFIKLN